MFDLFKVVIFAQLFYGLAITSVAYALPADAQQGITLFQEPTENLEMGQLSQDIQDGMQSQIGVPLIDMSALVFFSGNIVVDLILNSFFALPSMLSLALTGFFLFINIDPYLATNLKVFIVAMAAIVYVFGLMAFLINIRARSAVI